VVLDHAVEGNRERFGAHANVHVRIPVDDHVRRERWLREIDGFEGLMMLTNEDTTLGLAFWRTTELAERNRPRRREFLDRMMAVVGVEVEEIVDYTLTFSRVDPRLADPAG